MHTFYSSPPLFCKVQLLSAYTLQFLLIFALYLLGCLYSVANPTISHSQLIASPKPPIHGSLPFIYKCASKAELMVSLLLTEDPNSILDSPESTY